MASGVGIGTAYCIHDIPIAPSSDLLDDEASLTELARFEEACRAADAELRVLCAKVASQVGREQAAIFESHRSILHDPNLTEKIRHLIVEKRTNAHSALGVVIGEYERLFEGVKDEYLKERLADLRDVIARLGRHLHEDSVKSIIHAGPLILVVHELLPSDVVTLSERNIAGIVTQIGGPTSHAAVLARSYGIPAVSGVIGVLEFVANGDSLIVDGREGHVLVAPTHDAESSYRKIQREFVALKRSLAENRDRPSVSADGISIELLANINTYSDIELASAMGAQGIGLYRTEFFFLTHRNVPDEDEQIERYRQVIARSPGKVVTIRTLDLGGDKTVSYLQRSREVNPFMGWRSIRLSFEHPKFFLQQIRAVLRAAADQEKEVRLMFPMITTLQEIRRVRSFVREAERQLDRGGFARGKIRFGLMVEVPVAALAVETFLDEVDFVSIGSNDLVQYLTAADRDNPKVSHLCDPLNPAVLRVLATVIEACTNADIPVSLCGEMAGSPRGFLLLLGMGLRTFSMSAALIPAIKDLLTRVVATEAQRVFARAITRKTSDQVVRDVDEHLNAVWPEWRLLEIGPQSKNS